MAVRFEFFPFLFLLKLQGLFGFRFLFAGPAKVCWEESSIWIGFCCSIGSLEYSCCPIFFGYTFLL